MHLRNFVVKFENVIHTDIGVPVYICLCESEKAEAAAQLAQVRRHARDAALDAERLDRADAWADSRWEQEQEYVQRYQLRSRRKD